MKFFSVIAVDFRPNGMQYQYYAGRIENESELVPLLWRTDFAEEKELVVPIDKLDKQMVLRMINDELEQFRTDEWIPDTVSKILEFKKLVENTDIEHIYKDDNHIYFLV